MARNKQLAKVVLGQMFDLLKTRDPILMDEDRDLGSELLLELGRVDVDEDSKFRIIRGPILGYGYDFQGADGDSAKEMYERAVRNTKELSGKPNFETFVNSGVENDRYGWYLTRL